MRGREYSDRPITGVWLGPKNGVRLQKVSAYESCPQVEVRLYEKHVFEA